MISFFDNNKERFENLWPLPNGIMYNVYLILGKQITLVDAVDEMYVEALMSIVEDIIGNKPIDYLVINHLEPDHSGGIESLTGKYPQMQLIGNNATHKFIDGYYRLNVPRIEVKNTEKLSLGDYTLQFYKVPMVHWPETMFTFLVEEHVLFTCDFMGGFGIFPELIAQDDITRYFPELNRYYVNVLAKFVRNLSKALDVAKQVQPKTIAPGHGVVYTHQVEGVIKHYTNLLTNNLPQKVTIAYGTMYGHTEKMALHVLDKIRSYGIHADAYDVSAVHPSFIITEIFLSKAIVVASPTYNKAVFPPMEYVLRLVDHMEIQGKIAGFIGSKTWSGGVVKKMMELIIHCNWQVLDTEHENLCAPDQSDFEKCDTLALDIKNALDIL